MFELLWLSIGSAITLFVVVIVMQLKFRQARRLAERKARAQKAAKPPPQRRKLIVADNRSLETLALGVGQELASLASSVEGHAQLLCEGHGELLCERTGRSGQVIEQAERLWEAVRRLRFFSEKMKAFARMVKVPLEPARVTPLVQGLVHEIEDYAGGSLEVTLNTAPSLPMALVNTNCLRQALLFLVESVLALEPNTPGLTISAHTELNEDMDAEVLIEIQAESDAESDELVASANDSPHDIRFSYVAARNLLEVQGAWVSLTHRPGLSVVASVSLKATTSPPGVVPATPPAPAACVAAQDHQFGGILILDRNPGIREMLTDELRRLGRHVIACDEGRAAESLYTATPERFELLILEQDARRLSGEALAARALAERQDVRVVLLGSRLEVTQEPSDPRCARIPKPFGLMELRSVVSGLLGTGTAAEASLEAHGG